MIPKQKKLVALNADIRSMVQAICSLPGLIGMKEAKLIECCANINGRKLYAI